MRVVLPLVVVGGRAAVVPREPGGSVVVGDLATVVRRAAELEVQQHPRWLVASAAEALRPLVAAGVRVQRCWDVAEVHRLLHGGWRADLARVWASAHGLDPDRAPKPAGDDLFDLLDGGSAAGGDGADPDAAVRPDGYLRPDVLDPSWATSESRFRAVAAALTELAARQEQQLRDLGPRAVAAAYSESAAAVLCLELERDGLPVDRRAAEDLIAAAAGRRPDDEKDAERIRRERDARVLVHAPGREGTDLRNPAQVRDLLAAAGVSVPNTRKFGAGAVPSGASAGGRAPRVAEGGADRDDLRVPVARRARRPGRPSARRLDRLRRRRRPDDRPERAAQPARAAAARGRGRARAGVRPRRPRTDRASGAGRRLR